MKQFLGYSIISPKPFLYYPYIAKLKASVFDGPQIRKLMQGQTFTARMTVAEKAAWCSYVSVIPKFLGNTKASNYRNLVDVML